MRIFFLLALFLLTASFGKRQPTAYVFWGDSIMAGNELNHTGNDGPNNTYLRWPRQYTEGLKAGAELNNAQSGAPLCNNWGGNGPFENRLSQVETYSASLTNLLFIGYGFNDMYRALSPPNSLTVPQFLAVFIPKLTAAIEYIKTAKGWPADKIVIVWNYIVDNPPYYISRGSIRRRVSFGFSYVLEGPQRQGHLYRRRPDSPERGSQHHYGGQCGCLD